MFSFNFDYIPPWLAKLIGHVAGIFMVFMLAASAFVLISLFSSTSLPKLLILAGFTAITTLLGVAALKLLRSEERPAEHLFPHWVYRILEGIFGLGSLVCIPVLWMQLDGMNDFEAIEALVGMFAFIWITSLCHLAAQEK